MKSLKPKLKQRVGNSKRKQFKPSLGSQLKEQNGEHDKEPDTSVSVYQAEDHCLQVLNQILQHESPEQIDMISYPRVEHLTN